MDLSSPAPVLRRGVAGDRRISAEDDQIRHGRKTRPALFDGYKRHVLRDLDTGLVPAVGITPANVPEAAVTSSISADLDAAGLRLAELHIDRACLSSDLVRQRAGNLAIFCKAWRVRNTHGRYAKDQFSLDFTARRLTCPAGVSMPFQPGVTVRFPAHACAARPLRSRCTTSSNGRSVSIHPARRCSPGCASAADPGRPREAARTRPRRARPRPRRPLARPASPLPGHP